VTPQPRARLENQPPDLRAFLRSLPLQPAVHWVVLAILGRPVSRAAPRLLGAACVGVQREGVVAGASLLYALLVPPLAASAIYLLYGRRRLLRAPHRAAGDQCLALILVVFVLSAAALGVSLAWRWSELGPGLEALRGVCWPPAPRA
jgi:hypothetical protein